MSQIQSRPVGTCEVCGADTDHTSPLVCFGCVMAAQEQADTSLSPDPRLDEATSAVVSKFGAAVIPF